MRRVLTLLALFAVLPACTFVSKSEFTDRQDFDGDGFVAKQYGGDDCDDADAAINPGSSEICDGIDNDCDGIADNDDAADAQTWYADADGDGYGGGPVTACQRPDGYVPNADDCDDSDAAVNPGVTDEWYDGVDADCGGNSDYDRDADGFDSADYGGTDCNDEDAAINPGADEIWYDTVDQDCSGGSDFDQDLDGYDSQEWGGQDCDDTEGSTHPDADDAWYDGVDSNCDGLDDYDQDGDRHANTGSGGDDCDDGDSTVYGGAVEHCDSIDQDCDGETDDDESDDASTWYADGDGDRYGDGTTAHNACSQPDGYVSDSQDCDDSDASVTYITWFEDGDGDNYGNVLVSRTSCTKPAGYVADDTDCDDGAAGTNPGATEECDEADVDEDCDGLADDEDVSTLGKLTYYEDLDGDGYGDAARAAQYCDPSSRYVADGTDCDDASASTSPGASEKCDPSDEDEDCDGLADDDDDSVTGQKSYYTDADHDGYGYGTATLSCDVVPGRVTNDSDCNDTNASVSPATGGCDISLADAESTLSGDGANAYAGLYLADAGDVNADGFGDFLVGAPGTSLSGVSSTEGEAYVVYGPVVSGTSSLTDATADVYGSRRSMGVGSGLAGLGDVDGDGYDDVGIGVTGSDLVAVFLGPLAGSYADSAADAEVDVGTLSGAIANAGDVDGDGANDLLTGYAGDSTAGASAGAAYVYAVPTSGTVSAATTSLYGEAPGDCAGTAVAGGGDMNGDGLTDIVVGAPYADLDASGYSEGAVYVVFGPAASIGLADADAKLVGEASSANAYGFAIGDHAGGAVASPGDVDGDGYDDLLAGGENGGWNYTGTAFLELGPPSSGALHDAVAVIGGGTTDSTAIGSSLAGAGDVNADGYSDVLIHARYDGSGGYTYYGYAYVFLGPFSGSLDVDDANGTVVGAVRSAGLYQIVAGAGDVDADGSDDILVGSYSEDTYQGNVYLVLGSNF